MSEIEILDPTDSPFIRLTLSRDEAEIVAAALGDAPYASKADHDIGYDLFEALDSALGNALFLDGDPYDHENRTYDDPALADFDDEGNYVGF